MSSFELYRKDSKILCFVGLSASIIQTKLSPLANTIQCAQCKDAFTQRMKDVVTKWSMAKVKLISMRFAVILKLFPSRGPFKMNPLRTKARWPHLAVSNLFIFQFCVQFLAQSLSICCKEKSSSLYNFLCAIRISSLWTLLNRLRCASHNWQRFVKSPVTCHSSWPLRRQNVKRFSCELFHLGDCVERESRSHWFLALGWGHLINWSDMSLTTPRHFALALYPLFLRNGSYECQHQVGFPSSLKASTTHVFWLNVCWEHGLDWLGWLEPALRPNQSYTMPHSRSSYLGTSIPFTIFGP